MKKMLIFVPILLIFLAGCVEEIPHCHEIVTSKCRCGEQVIQTGYCCDGVASYNPCSGPSPQEERLCPEGRIWEECKCGSQLIQVRDGYCKNRVFSSDSIKFLENYPLESGWERKEVDGESYLEVFELLFHEAPGHIATIVLENSNITCQKRVLPEIEPKAEFAFAFFETGKRSVGGYGRVAFFEFKGKILQVFTKCGDVEGIWKEHTVTHPTFIRNLLTDLRGEMNLLETSLKEHILFLQNVSLPNGWRRENSGNCPGLDNWDPKKTPSHISFTNDGIICKQTIMEPWNTKALYSFCFYRKGSEPSLEDPTKFPQGPLATLEATISVADEYVIRAFQSCGGDPLPEFIQELITELEKHPY